MKSDFRGKTVLVTGASRGIGREIACCFAAAGARVIVHFKSNEKEAGKTIALLGEGEHFTYQADLAEPYLLAHHADKLYEAVGKIDILVNNAGIFVKHDILDLAAGTFRERVLETLMTNLAGPALLSVFVARKMAEQGGGSIINISSRGAFRGEPEAPAYGASKAGLNAFGQSMAKALARQKVFVYTVAPGFVETEMAEADLAGSEGDMIRNQSPFGRVASTKDVANAVLLLAADGNEFMTGCILDVNGASYLRT
ncbi:MAG: SDR family oxidoreductase [Bacteroidetes bacterium]|nr:SDR family oxidoreductase [Bacteroidota bacterium]MBU1719694.1 SDR family oxidoreductase [Bacteroidota bacterium]